MKNKVIIEILYGTVILLFFYTGLDKLLHREFFRVQLLSHHLLRHYAEWISWVLPLVELSISVLLVVPATRKAALRTGLILMIMFTAYLLYLTTTQKHLPCSCSGVISALSWTAHLWFNLGYIILIVLLTFLPDKILLQQTGESENLKNRVGV